MSTDILGIPVTAIPEQYTPIGVCALIECLDADGQQTFVIRHAGMSPLARVGALTVLQASEMSDWVACFEPTDGDQ